MKKHLFRPFGGVAIRVLGTPKLLAVFDRNESAIAELMDVQQITGIGTQIAWNLGTNINHDEALLVELAGVGSGIQSFRVLLTGRQDTLHRPLRGSVDSPRSQPDRP
jgi:hypothetical protein